MKCEMVRKRFIAYLDGDARHTERMCVDVHLAGCRACRDDLDALKEVLDAAPPALRHPAPVNRFGELREQMRRVSTVRPLISPDMRRQLWRLGQRFAAVVALVLVVSFGGPEDEASRRNGHAAAANTRHETPVVTVAFTTQRDLIEREMDRPALAEQTPHDDPSEARVQ